jgi:hypothetical protein
MSNPVDAAPRAGSQQNLNQAAPRIDTSSNGSAAVRVVLDVLQGPKPSSKSTASLSWKVKIQQFVMPSNKQASAVPPPVETSPKPDYNWLSDDGPEVIDLPNIPEYLPIVVYPSEPVWADNEKGIELPPKPLPEDENILSPKTFGRLFPERSPSLLPGVADINRVQAQLKGIDFSGTLNDLSLSAFIDKFSEMSMLQLYSCTQIGYPEWAHLHDLLKVTYLCLGKIERATPKDIWVMLRGWKSLKDVQFIDLPIDDRGLNELSLLPEVESLSLSECDRITVKGLYSLTKQDRAVALKRLSISGPSIDPLAVAEFKRRRPNVDLHVDEGADKSAAALAISEASLKMKGKTRFYYFLHKWGTEDVEEISTAYLVALKSIGIEPKCDEQTDHLGQWMWYDQLLQAYQNITRSAWAVRQEMVTASCFMKITDTDPDAPQTVEGIIDCLSKHSRKIQFLDFEDLELTYIPSFILNLNLLRLKKILLKGTHVSRVPTKFILKCLALEEIFYEGKDVEKLTPTPIAKDLRPIPEEMTEPTGFTPREKSDQKMPVAKQLPRKSWSAASEQNGKSDKNS